MTHVYVESKKKNPNLQKQRGDWSLPGGVENRGDVVKVYKLAGKEKKILIKMVIQ